VHDDVPAPDGQRVAQIYVSYCQGCGHVLFEAISTAGDWSKTGHSSGERKRMLDRINMIHKIDL